MIKTMAVKITEETYPIAIACLPSGFALIRKKLVMGCYLVINDLQFPDLDETGKLHDPINETEECEERPMVTRYGRHPRRGMYGNLTLVNFWERPKTFKKKFAALDAEPDLNGFFEVTRK